MLKKLSIKNLGCFDAETYSIDFSEETLIAGPNNSGKSLFLAGINLIRHHTMTGSPSWVTEMFNLFSFEDAVYAHEKNRTIEISVEIIEDTTKSQRTYDLKINESQGFRLMLNGQPLHRTEEDRDLMRNIWFFRPNRSLVPYSTPVQPSGSLFQPLRPDGSNVVNFLLERWTDRDKRWNVAESWLKKIDSDMTELKTPIRGNQAFLETVFGNVSVNVSLQGSGFQSAAAIVAAIVFSPDNSTIIIEEPEVFLHPDSQEVIIDMINDAVTKHKKQVIFSTHSCNILLPFYNDVSSYGAKRGAEHARADPTKFSMWTFQKTAGKVSVDRYPLQNKTFQHFRQDFKHIWG